ncbi:MAG: glucose-6-phosphate dehydrogenase [Sedimentisphaerales bacterium]|nr:glucose-6-phosphate dehydrogenase [Sedimentisphaerales bacterium]
MIPEIQPSILRQEMLCAEMQGRPCGLIVFGASGDLARRKIVPSLFALFRRDLLSPHFYFLGCGRSEYTDVQYRQAVREAMEAEPSGTGNAERFLSSFYYLSGDYTDASFYEAIGGRLNELDRTHKVSECHIFYLSVPPTLYGSITEHLGAAGVNRCGRSVCEYLPRLVVEKPFGHDLASATKLDAQIHRHFEESQIYRIDHYLGKETVQNILMFRFANAIFEPMWNRNYIDHIQITIAESVGVEHRAGYYDHSGALRDMFQNHMLQMMSLAMMEPPPSFDAEPIRDEKVKLLRSIRPLQIAGPWNSDIVRAQYVSGVIDGIGVPGYLQEKDVGPNSQTETFVAAKAFVDNWRWKDVPVYLRTGKRLAAKRTEIAIQFRQVPHSLFASVGLDDMPPNVLVLKIQPEEGISLSFQAKRPGSKTCMSTLRMNFNYSDIFGAQAPESYQRLLLDCMLGDQTLFARQDDVMVAWTLLAPVLEAWAQEEFPLYEYPAGSESFAHADQLIRSDGRQWRSLRPS